MGPGTLGKRRLDPNDGTLRHPTLQTPCSSGGPSHVRAPRPRLRSQRPGVGECAQGNRGVKKGDESFPSLFWFPPSLLLVFIHRVRSRLRCRRDPSVSGGGVSDTSRPTRADSPESSPDSTISTVPSTSGSLRKSGPVPPLPTPPQSQRPLHRSGRPKVRPESPHW